ncbi:hypothetical protein C7M84_001557 [Penaeus vannamei]|uniref:Uncharacterized protein n=1 Tax=Penaeus vannamei TaxID=6689 RepID=A0A423UBC7_PENVA|nr:hypothetical protein C7M84_001557 [Penaeus vannamei]
MNNRDQSETTTLCSGKETWEVGRLFKYPVIDPHMETLLEGLDEVDKKRIKNGIMDYRKTRKDDSLFEFTKHLRSLTNHLKEDERIRVQAGIHRYVIEEEKRELQDKEQLDHRFQDFLETLLEGLDEVDKKRIKNGIIDYRKTRKDDSLFEFMKHLRSLTNHLKKDERIRVQAGIHSYVEEEKRELQDKEQLDHRFQDFLETLLEGLDEVDKKRIKNGIIDYRKTRKDDSLFEFTKHLRNLINHLKEDERIRSSKRRNPSNELEKEEPSNAPRARKGGTRRMRPRARKGGTRRMRPRARKGGTRRMRPRAPPPMVRARVGIPRARIERGKGGTRRMRPRARKGGTVECARELEKEEPVECARELERARGGTRRMRPRELCARELEKEEKVECARELEKEEPVECARELDEKRRFE